MKFGNGDLINNANKQVEGIRNEMQNMKNLWDHIKACITTFDGFMEGKWIETNPFDMEEDTKKLMK